MTSVPQLTDDCVACGAVFRPNSDLSAMPRGRRVAWDRASGRTWRICTRCGHWNLLGSEAGASLATELGSRLPGRAAGGVMHDLVGSVEVVLIDDVESGRVGTRAGIVARKSWRFLMHPVVKALASPVALFVGIDLVGAALGYSLLTYEVWHYLVLLGVGLLLAKELALVVFGQPVKRTLVIGLAVGAVAVIMFPPAVVSGAWLGRGEAAVMLVVMMGLAAFLELFGPPFIPVLTRQRKRYLTPFGCRAAELALSPVGDEIVLRALGRRRDRTVQGTATERALMWLVMMGRWEPSVEDLEAGWLLARGHGSSVGLLRHLLTIHPEAGGRILVRDLPAVWRAAFIITCTESQGDEREREKLLGRIREASGVAAIAERLEAAEGER